MSPKNRPKKQIWDWKAIKRFVGDARRKSDLHFGRKRNDAILICCRRLIAYRPGQTNFCCGAAEACSAPQSAVATITPRGRGPGVGVAFHQVELDITSISPADRYWRYLEHYTVRVAPCIAGVQGQAIGDAL